MIENNKKLKKFISFVLVLAMVFNYFIPLHKAFAASQTTSLSVSFRENNVGKGKVQYSLNDGANWTDVSANTNDINIAVTGDNLRIKIVPQQDYETDYTGIDIKLDGTSVAEMPIDELNSGDGYSVPDDVESVSIENLEFREKEEVPPVYDGTAHVSVTVIGTEIENPYGEDASEVRVSVNEGNYVTLAPENVEYEYEVVENEQRISRVTTKTPIDIGYHNVSDDKVVIGVRTQWNTILTDVTINNTSYNNELPTTKDELIALYNNQSLIYEFEVLKSENDNYNIVVEGRKQNENEIIMGNFLWDYNEQGYTDPEDKIFHSTLQFVKAKYGNQEFTTVADLNAAGGLYDWKDAPKKDVYVDEGEGVGSATFPVGTELTVKIIPDAGYQLVSFGVNEGGFEPQEEIGVYTFEIGGGNFHLQAHVEDVENAVNAKNSNSVEGGSIEFGGVENSMNIGTARLDIEDNDNLTGNQINGFEDAAEDYEIQGVYDVSLFNTVFKGSVNASWDTQVDELNNSATITLEMSDNLNGKDIIIIHETHDGDYEVIDVEYDANSNSISFETDSFSNYAVATKGEGTDPVVVKHTVEFDTNGGSAIENVEVEHGKSLERPKIPTKEGFTFGGWFIEPELNYSYDFEGPVEGDFTLYARWIDNDDLKDYTITNDDGNSISFTDEEGHNYKLNMFDILSLSKEEIMAMDPTITEESYEQMIDLLKDITKSNGELLKVYEIEVFEDNTVTNDITSLHEGPFNVKIKLTDEMKKYDTFKLIYLKNDFTLGEVVELTIEGDYAVGNVPHLSTYMLTGSITGTTNGPNTNDNIGTYITILGVSLGGLLAVTFIALKKKKTNH